MYFLNGIVYNDDGTLPDEFDMSTLDLGKVDKFNRIYFPKLHEDYSLDELESIINENKRNTRTIDKIKDVINNYSSLDENTSIDLQLCKVYEDAGDLNIAFETQKHTIEQLKKENKIYRDWCAELANKNLNYQTILNNPLEIAEKARAFDNLTKLLRLHVDLEDENHACTLSVNDTKVTMNYYSAKELKELLGRMHNDF